MRRSLGNLWAPLSERPGPQSEKFGRRTRQRSEAGPERLQQGWHAPGILSRMDRITEVSRDPWAGNFRGPPSGPGPGNREAYIRKNLGEFSVFCKVRSEP